MAGTGDRVTRLSLDAESEEWLRALAASGREREAGLDRLHALLLRVARHEVNRRSASALAGPELADLSHHAAADAMLAILKKLAEFRGDSRFTTWAYKFVMFEVSDKLGQHYRQKHPVALEIEDWDRLPDRFGLNPETNLEVADLMLAIRRAVDDSLTPHQRRVFVALVVVGVPLDTLARELDGNRNAIYKVMFDARRKIRAALVQAGYIDPESRPS